MEYFTLKGVRDLFSLVSESIRYANISYFIYLLSFKCDASDYSKRNTFCTFLASWGHLFFHPSLNPQ